MNNINVKDIVDEVFKGRLDSLVSTLEMKSNEDTESEVEYIAKIIPDIIEFNKDVTAGALEKYHQQLIAFLNSLNLQE